MTTTAASVFSAGIYLFYFLGIGTPIAAVCRTFNSNRFFLAFGFSVSWLVLSQIPFNLQGGKLIDWYYLFFLVTAAVIVSGIVVKLITDKRKRTKKLVFRLRNSLGALVVGCTFTVYHIGVGPYTEIPSDFWARIGDVSTQLDRIDLGQFVAVDSYSRILDDKIFIPFVHAIIAKEVNIAPLWIVPSATWATSILFLLAVYFFTLKLVAPVRLRRPSKILIATLAPIITMLGFGVSTFSYVRYYAYFPHIVNATLMISILALFVDLLRNKQQPRLIAAILFVFFVVQALINKQEFLFTLILTGVMGIAVLLKYYWKICRPNLGWARIISSCAILLVTIIFIGGSIGKTTGIWAKPHLIDLGEIHVALKGFLIANPAMRFADTLGIFGIVVYVWYLFRLNWFKGNLYIHVGMVSPLFTLFNPIFVAWFIEWGSWDSLWRFSYLMPLSITASVLVGYTYASNMGRTTMSRSAIVDLALFFAMVISLLPVNVGGYSNNFSRVPSLMPVHASNGALVWEDLLRFLDSIPDRPEILTDYVTNYVVTSALGLKGTPSAKEIWQKKTNVFSGDYQDRLLYYEQDDKILVINLKGGKLSENGRKSGHWPEDILDSAAIYPPDIVPFLESRPSDFQELWKRDKIFVYKILRNPTHY